MDIKEKMHLFANQHNVSSAIRFPEITLLFDDGFAALTHGIFLAASLCFITGIEMSLRLPLLFAQKKDIRDAWQQDIPLLKNELLRRARDHGLPIHLLRYPDEDETEYLAKLNYDNYDSQLRITRVRNNICHGNLNIFVTKHDDGPRIYSADIEQEARCLGEIVKRWASGFKEAMNKE